MRSAGLTREQELLAAARRSDQDAAVALIGQNQRSIASGLRSAGLHPGDAMYEDAQNQALIAIWQELPRYRGESKLSTWMFSIAKRTAQSRTIEPESRERRRRRRNQEKTMYLDLVESGGEEALEERDLLARVLDQLSDEDREVLLMRAALELSMAEIGSALFLSEAGAKARYRRARQRAAAVVRKLEEELS